MQGADSEYRLAPWAAINYWGVVVTMTALGVAQITYALWAFTWGWASVGWQTKLYMMVGGPVLLGLLMLVLLFVASVPTRIAVEGDALIFQSLMSSTVVPVSGIRAIARRPIIAESLGDRTTFEIVDIAYDGGAIRLQYRIRNMHDLVTAIRSANPRVTVSWFG